MPPPKVETSFGSHQPTNGATMNSSNAPSMVAPKRTLQNFCTKDSSAWSLVTWLLGLFQLDAVFLEHLREGQHLKKIHDVPDFIGGKVLTGSRHGHAVDSGVNPPVEIDGPAAATKNSRGQVRGPHDGAPGLVLVSAAPAQISV